MNQKQDEGLYNVHPAPFTCSLCGKTDDLSNYDPSEYLLLMHKHHVCFHCAFWMAAPFNHFEKEERDQVRIALENLNMDLDLKS